MEKKRQEAGMGLNYKINGHVHSFKSVEELLFSLKTTAEILKEPLMVEPIDKEGHDYDHMQEILELTYEAIPCIKGIQAMALGIQERGNFNDFDTTDMIFLGLRCKELLEELMNIAEASEHVYESDWKAKRQKREFERSRAAG